MPLAELSASSLYYELTGPMDGEPLVLIHGFGAQMIAWHPELCDRLADGGFTVIRFDNRDVGLSRKFDGHSTYTLTDMADDVADLIDHLARGPVHILGQSMGGMIAQRLAIGHPDKVVSLCLVYTTPSLDFFTGEPEFVALASQPAAQTRQDAIEQWIRKESFSGTNGFDVRELAAKVYDRCFSPDGMARQWSAVQSSKCVLAELRTLDMPTAVVHGRADRLISSDASLAIAEAIPSSDLHLYSQMGHEIPPTLWSEIVHIVTRTAARAGSSSLCL